MVPLCDTSQLPDVLVAETLARALDEVPDPRKPKGKRYRIGPILCLAICAMLCGSRSLYAIAQWGKDHGPEIARALGFRNGQSPDVSTLHRIFTRMDVDRFEAILGKWFAQQGSIIGDAIAIDGKSLRGIHGEEPPGVHLVAAYAHRAGVVLGQKGGKGQTRRVIGRD
jgi:hypothetical protein